jgi:ribosome-associated heat shock protein Hsp15
VATSTEKVRLDRWLWAARFFKTRAQAKQAVDGGKVHYNGKRTKAAKDVAVGAELTITRGFDQLTVIVEALASRRGGAKDAQLLYQETPASIRIREREAERRRAARAAIELPMQRPDKRDRRELARRKRAEQDQ